MSSDEYCQHILNYIREMADHHGWAFLDTPRIAFGVLIYFDANPFSWKATGCLSSWITSRRIVGFGVHAGDVDGIALCCMFNSAIRNKGLPKRLSSDPLFRYHQWQANLRILEIEEIKSIPYSPTSHPFIERLIGTIRREYLDRLFFWNDQDLERKLAAFQHYYNEHRAHLSLKGSTPMLAIDNVQTQHAKLDNYSWQSHCKGLYLTPIAAWNLNPPCTRSHCNGLFQTPIAA